MWQAHDRYHMVAKIFSDHLTGEKGVGFYACSDDGIDWSFPEDPGAYTRTVTFADGSQRKQPALERPQVLVQNGEPTHIFLATVDPGWSDIYNLVIPVLDDADSKALDASQ